MSHWPEYGHILILIPIMAGGSRYSEASQASWSWVGGPASPETMAVHARARACVNAEGAPGLRSTR